MRFQAKQTYAAFVVGGLFAAAAANLSIAPVAMGNPGHVWSFNTVKQKMLRGETIRATRLTSNTAVGGNPGSDPGNFCTVAKTPSNDFVWTDMVHSGLEFSYTWKMWATLPSCGKAAAPLVGAEIFFGKRVNFVTKAYFRAPDPAADQLNTKEMSRATDGGAMVVIIEAENQAQAESIVQRAYYPPLGARDLGPLDQVKLVYPTAPSYADTYNDNVTIFVNVSTIEGVSNAFAIAAVNGVHGVFLDTANLESESGYPVGSPDFTMLQNQVVQAFRSVGKYVCIPTWNTTSTNQTTPDTLTCTP